MFWKAISGRAVCPLKFLTGVFCTSWSVKFGAQNMKWGYKNFKHQILLSHKVWNRVFFFFCPCTLGIDGAHLLVFPPNLLDDGPSWSFEDFLSLKDANVGCFIAISNLRCAILNLRFFLRGKPTFWTKQILVGKDEIMRKRIKMFLCF